MIILVGVTVNVALNGGLFSSTQKAAYQTEVRTVQEQLEAEKVVKIAENDGNIPSDFGITISNLAISEELKNKYGEKLIISKDGTLYYNSSVVIDEEEQSWLEEIGIETYEGQIEDIDLSLLEKYFLGEDKQGKDLTNLVRSYDMITNIIYIDDPNTIEDETDLASNIYSLNAGIVGTDENENEIYYLMRYYIKYNNKAYVVKVEVNSQNEYITKSIEYKYTPYGREGEKYECDIDGDGENEQCTILYDYGEGQGIEIVAPTVIGANLNLGYGDTTIDWEDEDIIVAADMDKNETLENIEKAIYSYNHAIETINNYCKEQVTNNDIPKENIRSVGSNPSFPYKDDAPLYTSENLVSYPTYNGVAKGSDNNYEQDLIRMSYFGVANINNSYWLASRLIEDTSTSVCFDMMYVYNFGDFYMDILWYINPGDIPRGLNLSYGVRPIIKIPNV